MYVALYRLAWRLQRRRLPSPGRWLGCHFKRVRRGTPIRRKPKMKNRGSLVTSVAAGMQGALGGRGGALGRGRGSRDSRSLSLWAQKRRGGGRSRLKLS